MPEILRNIIDDHSLYAIWEITETTDELFNMIRLRPSEDSLYGSFLVESRKKQWLAYRILIRSLLSPDDCVVEYDEMGKPYLAGSSYHISVTHSGDLAGVILSSTGLAGIDIEKIRGKIEKVADKFLNPEELALVSGRDRQKLLTMAWCAKEALYKLYGRKNLDFKENIRLYLSVEQDIGSFMGEIIQGESSRMYTLVSRQFGEYMLVYALEPTEHTDLRA